MLFPCIATHPLVGQRRDEQQRLRVRVIDPGVGGRRHAQTTPLDVGLRQLVPPSVVRPHVAVDVEVAQRLRIFLGPSLAQRQLLLRTDDN